MVWRDGKVQAVSDPFNIDRAITAAHWAGMAYGKEPLAANCQMVIGDSPSDVQCLVVDEPDRLTFAFRGTFDNRGWLQDSKIAFRDYRGIKMHTGFFEDVDAVWKQLSGRAISASALAKKPVYITGHSKGAGECLVLAYRLASEWKIIAKEIFTFGGPRVFNRAGSRAYEKLLIPTWRVIDKADIVCRIPYGIGIGLSFPFMDFYRHVGQTAYFDGYNQLRQNEPAYENLESDFTEIVRELLHRQDALRRDHGMQLYIDTLASWKAQLG
jgi:hypothetical protein